MSTPAAGLAGTGKAHHSKSAPKSSKHGAKKSTKPKKELSTEERLKKLFNSLCSQIDGGHFANGVKSCNKILALSPADPDAIHTKIWLLLQTEKYAEALALLSPQQEDAAKSKPVLGELKLNLPFEHAYTLYRLNRLPEAKTVLASAKQKGEIGDENEKGVKHLEAQMHYRDGDYDAAVDVYERLLDGLDDPEETSDIQTNIHASTLHLDFINSGYSRALSQLPSSVTSNLESAPPPTTATTSGAAAAAASVPVVETKDAPTSGAGAPKPPRRRRLPKNLPPNAPPPDPERWLKKSERSTFMGSQRRRKGQGGGATQGASLDPVATPAVSSGGGKGKKGKKK